MKEEPTYHIDVTPEEDALFKDNVNVKITKKFVPTNFKKVFCLVLGAHLFVGAAIVMSSNVSRASVSNPSASFTKTIAEEPALKPTPVVPTEPIAKPTVKPEATPTPKPQVASETNPSKAQNKLATKQPIVQHSNEKFIKEYTIKQGDTLTTIAKKYKLSTQRLIKINNIKDVNKIQVGQKLKFM